MCKKICLVILILAIGQISYAGLVAHWKLDDGSGTTAADSSGNGHDGTLLLDPQWVAGKYGGALEFSGTAGQRVEMYGYEGILGTQNRTVMAWVKTAGYGDWISWGQNVNTQKWIGRIQDNASNGTVGALRTECSGGYIIGSTVLTDNEWHHVVSVLESAGAPAISDITMYVDGAPEQISGSQAVSINTVGGRNVWIADGHHNRPLPSLIDDVRIYDHAMTQVEVLAAMQGAEKYPYALAPDPKDGALLLNTWANLSWSPGDFAVSHDVYLGDNFDEVNDATHESSIFRGNQTATSLFVGFPGNPYPDGLVPGTTYYWRIDEVNDAEPNSPWKGSIWSFSIAPRTAYNPNPADGAESVDLGAALSWTPGFGAKLHHVYFGDDFDVVSNATGALPQGMTTYTPASLESEKVYYWRVDEFDAVDTHKGDVWSFATLGAVGNPQPSNGATDAEMNALLTWTPSAHAASHQVYFGMDKEAVRKADAASPEYKGPKALGAESYDPGLLQGNTTYYWRIDEVNTVNPKSPWKGPIWTFTTGGSLLVDDFEGYDVGNNEIWWSWKDGLGYAAHDNQPAYPGNGTGSAVGDETTASYTEETIVHGGGQSMPVAYDNNKQGFAKYSEVELTLTSPRDWTANGVTTLTIWFRGNSSNSAEPLYVAIANRTGNPAVVVHEDAGAAQKQSWTKWVIPLTAFADKGINLTDVDKISIGLGTRGNQTAPGGSGKMYFDDIQLSRTAP